MLLYPAIDLKQGQCVRLWRGEMNRATVFSDDPGGQARKFAAQGCQRLHVVDLDGAFAGKPMNAAAVDAILAAVSVPVQLGGGIRDLDTVARWLERGIARVVLGTLALRAPEIVRAACRKFPNRVAIGIDAKGGRVAVEGWAEASEVSVLDLARKFEDSGAAAIIHTDIERDGTMAGLNVEAAAELAARLSIPVIASGGVASLDDIKALKKVSGSGIEGVIVGRALYDGRLDLQQALAVLEDPPC
ncbi:MAG TPA: 1-(5-phosphoribosyl)-5-[(5-phosphoribosylamino)methylideneamino]imidazole-4-carboxamide isomerase [Alphaproteobacteria bacterium]|nr:1-(5-phosphoribosyl)-5-[(5-phosphoribosylamino)methylideneamino]imidazole-4-carboxamide isomerase [Alphaproteobacteria bacterium]